ncbi:MAG: type II toxin-antitoxin system RelE/ParE family toxin [Hyphomonadaceae bacterium]|nr:type II toxin-antitoxin system RelE/ParE family toxin [Hyphomonadaceae bacterium]GIK50453.1 MAG: toxin ParE1 [Alphaproteobacteria bacterium]
MPKPIATRELRLRPAARRDLAGIYTYTRRQWSRQQADRYVAALRAELERVRERPEIGRRLRDAQAPFLRRVCGSHVIFYLADDDVLDVVRILHASMDFAAHLANDDS